jgi:hypothetical protein
MHGRGWMASTPYRAPNRTAPKSFTAVIRRPGNTPAGNLKGWEDASVNLTSLTTTLSAAVPNRK